MATHIHYPLTFAVVPDDDRKRQLGKCVCGLIAEFASIGLTPEAGIISRPQDRWEWEEASDEEKASRIAFQRGILAHAETELLHRNAAFVDREFLRLLQVTDAQGLLLQRLGLVLVPLIRRGRLVGSVGFRRPAPRQSPLHISATTRPPCVSRGG